MVLGPGPHEIIARLLPPSPRWPLHLFTLPRCPAALHRGCKHVLLGQSLPAHCAKRWDGFSPTFVRSAHTSLTHPGGRVPMPFG